MQDRDQPGDGEAGASRPDDEVDTDPAPPVAALEGSDGVTTPREEISTPEPSVPTVREPTARRRPGPNDSVEALLGGLPKPNLRMPAHAQSDGKDSAAYHGQHSIPHAQTSHEEEAKVVVARSPLGSTTRIVRGRPEILDVRGTRDATSEGASRVTTRIVLALVAAMAVVAVVFVVLSTNMRSPDAAESGPGAASASQPSAPGTTRSTKPVPSPMALATAPSIVASAPAPSTMGPASSEPLPVVSAAPADSGSGAPAAGPSMSTTGSAKSLPSQRTRASAPAGSGGALGEFKTSF